MNRPRSSTLSTALVVILVGCGPRVAADSTATEDTSDTQLVETDPLSTGSADESTTTVLGSTSGDPWATTTGDAIDSTNGESTGPACPSLPDLEGESEVLLRMRNVGRTPVWVELDDSCDGFPLFVDGPDGRPVDIIGPSCNGATCQDLIPPGEGGSCGFVCPSNRLAVLEPGDIALDGPWTGAVFVTETIPPVCADGRDTCVRSMPAPAGTYVLSARVSSAAVCGDRPCVCDGGSDPCKIDDPTAMLVDPQTLEIAIEFPRDEQAVFDLALP